MQLPWAYRIHKNGNVINLSSFNLLRVASLLLLLPVFFKLEASTPAKYFEELVSEGYGGVRFGNSVELGDYILSVSMSQLAAGTDPSTAIETVRIIAQRDLAGILGTKMSSKTEIKTSSQTITVDNQTKTEVKEFFSDLIQTDINQYLRGATVF